MCKIFAKRWNASVDDAIIAGLLHDIGKSQSKKEMLSLCMRNNITIYDFELWGNPIALHGKIGSFLFEKEFNKNEPERFNQISHAISCHVAGSDDMNLLDKIVFIADYIEDGRDFPGVSEARELANQDLDAAVIYKIKQTLKHLVDREERIYPGTLTVYNQWMQKMED